MPRNYKTDLFKKRQYEWLAETIRNLSGLTPMVHPDPIDDDWVRGEVAKQFARALSGSNPRFDRERFLRACEPNDDESMDPDPSQD